MDAMTTLRAIVDGVLAVVEDGFPSSSSSDPATYTCQSTWKTGDDLVACVVSHSGGILVSWQSGVSGGGIGCATVEEAVSRIVPLVRRLRAA